MEHGMTESGYLVFGTTATGGTDIGYLDAGRKGIYI